MFSNIFGYYLWSELVMRLEGTQDFSLSGACRIQHFQPGHHNSPLCCFFGGVHLRAVFVLVF